MIWETRNDLTPLNKFLSGSKSKVASITSKALNVAKNLKDRTYLNKVGKLPYTQPYNPVKVSNTSTFRPLERTIKEAVLIKTNPDIPQDINKPLLGTLKTNAIAEKLIKNNTQISSKFFGMKAKLIKWGVPVLIVGTILFMFLKKKNNNSKLS